MRTGNLYVISGPSGTGKGTMVNRLLELVPDAWVSVSCTTRAPREGEEDGIHYFFKTREEFDRMAANGELLEWAVYNGNGYGTPKAVVEQHIAAGEQVILEIEVQGAFQVKELIPETHLVFIEPPSLEVLEQRLRGRGTEDEQTIQGRLAAAELELSRKMEYDMRIVNNQLDVAVDELVRYVNQTAER